MATKLTTSQIAAKKAALPSKKQAQVQPVTQKSTQTARFVEAERALNRQNVGIRPGQFGEIDEAAGERVQIDRNTNTAAVYDAQGNKLRDVGDVYSVQQRTEDTRRDAGAPLISSKSGAQGVSGSLAFNPTPEEEEAVGRYARGEGYASAPTQGEVQSYRNAIAEGKIIAEQGRQVARETAGARMAADAAAQNATMTQSRNAVRTAADSSLVNQMMAALPDTPESRFVAQAYQDQLTAENSLQDFQAEAYGLREGQAQDFYSEVEGKLKTQKGRAQKTFADVTEMYEDSLEKKNELIAIQQENDLAKNDALFQSQSRQARTALRKQLDEATVTMALMGRAGSLKANTELEQAEFDGEQAILELQRDIGNKRSDIAAFYTGKYIEAEDKMIGDWYNAKDKLDTELGRIEGQGIANSQVKKQAIDGAFADFVNATVTSKREAVKIKTDAAKDVRAIIAEEKTMQRNDSVAALNELKWYRDVYGQNPPQGVKESLQKRMPTMDVNSFFSTSTVDELAKAAKRVTGGGSINFSLGDFKAGVPESKEDYIAKKIMEYKSDFSSAFDEDSAIAAEEERIGMSMTESAKEEFLASLGGRMTEKEIRAQAAEEYDAKMANYGSLDPSQIQKDLDLRLVKANLPEAQQKTIKNAVERAMKGGDYQHARSLVDEVGARVSSGNAEDFGNAMQTRSMIITAKAKFDGLGTTGPLAGRFRKMDLWDPELAEFRALLTSTIPSLARGVFQEVGVLTDQDIARYESVVFSPQSTVAQAELQYDLLMNIINTRLNTQVGVWDANGMRTSGFKKLLETPAVGIESGASSDASYIQNLKL